MTTKYVEVKFRNTQQHEVVGKVDTDLTGADLLDAVAVPEGWLDRFFGEDEAGYWEIEEITEISKEEALRREREVDIDTFLIETGSPEQDDATNHEDLVPQVV